MGDAPTELVIIDLEVGDGAEATPGATVDVHYVGVDFETGEEFDASWGRGAVDPVPAERPHHGLAGGHPRHEGRRTSPAHLPAALAYGPAGGGHRLSRSHARLRDRPARRQVARSTAARVPWGREDLRRPLRGAQREGRRRAPRARGTVAELDAGVHAIGKKIVEEAAEVWMAAEYQSDDETAEEISQLLYHLQVLMLAKGLTLDGCLRDISERDPPDHPLRPERPHHAENRRAQQGLAVRDRRRRCCSEAGYADASRPEGADRRATRATTSSSSTCARATSPPTSDRARSMSASPAATCCSTRARSAVEIDEPRLRRLDLPLRRADRALPDAAATCTGVRVATSYAGLVARLPRARTACRPTVVRLDGAVESAVRLGVADAVADVVETGIDPREAGSRDLRPGHPRVAAPC